MLIRRHKPLLLHLEAKRWVSWDLLSPTGGHADYSDRLPGFQATPTRKGSGWLTPPDPWGISGRSDPSSNVVIKQALCQKRRLCLYFPFDGKIHSIRWDREILFWVTGVGKMGKRPPNRAGLSPYGRKRNRRGNEDVNHCRNPQLERHVGVGSSIPPPRRRVTALTGSSLSQA